MPSASFSSKNCAGEIAKNAVSAPEIYPEMKSKTTSITNSIMKPAEKVKNGEIMEADSDIRKLQK